MEYTDWTPDAVSGAKKRTVQDASIDSAVAPVDNRKQFGSAKMSSGALNSAGAVLKQKRRRY